MTDKELLQQALHYMDDNCGAYTDDYRKLIEAIRARLSQCDRCGEVNPAEIHTCSPQRQQRTYTLRKWQGLTAKDLAEIPPSCYEGAIWADAKLKEKNSG